MEYRARTLWFCDRACYQKWQDQKNAEWSAQHGAVASPSADEILSMLESAIGKDYNGNETLWNQVLCALNLGALYQPAIAVVLKQGRWRGAKNPRAYVARASFILALSMKLRDFTEREFKRVPSSLPVVPLKVSNGDDEPMNAEDLLELQAHRAYSGDACKKDGAWRMAVPTDAEGRAYAAHGEDYSAYDNMEYCIPKHLKRDDDPTRMDWSKVAGLVVLKTRMREPVALVLERRYEQGMTRTEALAGIRHPQQRLKFEDAWRWVDRNWRARIVPILQSDGRPKPEQQALRRGPVPPWMALLDAIEKREVSRTPDYIFERVSDPRSSRASGWKLDKLLGQKTWGQLEREKRLRLMDAPPTSQGKHCA